MNNGSHKSRLWHHNRSITAKAEISRNIPKGFLHDLGPEDLLLVQVDSAVTVPHPVWPRVRRDVFRFSCTGKSEKEQQEGEGKQLLDRNAAESKNCYFIHLSFLHNAFHTLDRNRVNPLYKRKEVAVWQREKKKEEQLYNEATQMLWAANNSILHLDGNCLWVQTRTTKNIQTTAAITACVRGLTIK